MNDHIYSLTLDIDMEEGVGVFLLFFSLYQMRPKRYKNLPRPEHRWDKPFDKWSKMAPTSIVHDSFILGPN